MGTVIDYDVPSSFLPLVDECIRRTLPTKEYAQVRKIHPEYIDDAIGNIKRICSVEDVFVELFIALRDVEIWCHHATRLSQIDFDQIGNEQFGELASTCRVKLLEQRIHKYWTKIGLRFSYSSFVELVREFHDRDNQATFFSLSKSFLKYDCTHYLHFGSEFEQVIVTHLLGRHHRKLLKEGTRAAFVSWKVNAREITTEKSVDDVLSSLETGNVPELANDLLNAWLLWRIGQESDIAGLRLDHSVIFRRPFRYRDQKLEWVDENKIGPVDP